MAYITCEDVAVGYEGKVVTKNINFHIDAGNYLCIVGENGAGKSTLMKTLLNLRKAMHGKILIGDGLKPYEIGYLPQQTVVQKDFPASVWEVVLSGCLGHMGFRPFYTHKEKELAMKNMERMEIANLKNTCYRDLSGGQQQRVLLARALCATQKLLILDEPVAGLDPKVTEEMYKLIADINRKEGIAIIMVSHDLQAAVTYASHILHLGEEPLFFGKTSAYLKSDIGKIFTGQVEDEDVR